MSAECDEPEPELPGVLERFRRAWVRDRHLGFKRRLLKGIQFASQTARASIALRDCDRVGSNARVAGRMRVENRGRIVLGHYLNINSSWVPTELLTGTEGTIEIGDDVLINFGTVVAAGKSVTIGEGSMIGPHCIISDVDIPEELVGASAAPAKPIVIGKDVWIAGRVTIRPGVSIGDGAVIVAGSIVETDIPAQVMASGIPARLLPKLGESASTPDVRGGDSSADPRRKPPPVRMKGTIVSDFSLDELAQALSAADTSPPVDAHVMPHDEFLQSLAASPPASADDFSVVWTRPESAMPTFDRLISGESIDERQLNAEVDQFCRLLEQIATKYKYVLIPTWTLPPYHRGQPLLDGRPGGVLAALAVMNLRLMTTVGRRSNVFVLNAARWQATVGSGSSNPRAWYLGRMAMARPILLEAAKDIRAALGALRGCQRMLLVLDSEDALWGSAAAESTIPYAAMKLAHFDFDVVLSRLKRRGVLVSQLPADGAEPAQLQSLATRLGVSLDAIVYITADRSVRQRVRAALPSVLAPDWPSDVLLFPSALHGLRCFDTPTAIAGSVAASQ